MKLSDNRLFKGELVLTYLDYPNEWRRTLFCANGTYVEVDLTSRGGVQGWDQVRSINIRKHCNARSRKDRVYRAVIDRSPVFQEVISLMRPHIPDDVIAALLYRDFLPEIDWAKYGIKRFQSPLSECRKEIS